jgi:ketosteroid isomerase-like protein
MDDKAVLAEMERALRATDFAAFAALFADDALFEYPFEHPVWPSELRGRAAISEHLVESRRNLTALIRLTGFESVAHETTEPGVYVLEHEVSGVRVATGEAFRFASGIAVVTIRDGRVTRYRDYTNPFGSAKAIGTLPHLAEAITAATR